MELLVVMEWWFPCAKTKNPCKTKKSLATKFAPLPMQNELVVVSACKKEEHKVVTSPQTLHNKLHIWWCLQWDFFPCQSYYSALFFYSLPWLITPDLMTLPHIKVMSKVKVDIEMKEVDGIYLYWSWMVGHAWR